MLTLNFYPFPALKTERLLLRQLTTADAAEVFLLRSDEAVNKFIDRPKATTIEDASKFIYKINNRTAKTEGLYWGISLKNEPALVGTICYWNNLEEINCAEIGYELNPAWQGKGIMQEAIGKVISFGFSIMHLEMITAFTHPGNKKSVTLLEKHHFRRDEKQEQEGTPVPDAYIKYNLLKPGK